MGFLDALLTPSRPSGILAALSAPSIVDHVQAGPIIASADDTIYADVTPWATIDMMQRRARMHDEAWQTKARRYDREGPGIVGAAVDLPAATSTLLSLTVQQRNPYGGWETIDDPYLHAVLAQFRNEAGDQIDLFRSIIRTLDLVGEGYLVLHNPEAGRFFWQLAHTTNVADKMDGSVEIRTRRNAAEGTPWHRRVNERNVYHFHQGDNEWQDEAWSPLLRGLPDLERYRAAMRNVGRNLDSQLAMNGILWAKAVVGGSKWDEAVKAWAAKAISSDDGIEAVAPFMMQTAEKPEWLDTGRGMHAEQLSVADSALVAFARSTDIPTKMLVEGPGSGNHWNSYLEGDFYADMTMQPRWKRAAAIVTEVHLRPFLRALPSGKNYDPDRLRVWCDDTRLRTRTDNTDRVIEARRMGIATREAVAESIGLRDDQVLELPDGVSEQEWWTLVDGGDVAVLDAERGEVLDQVGNNLGTQDPGEPVRAGLGPSAAESSTWSGLVPA